MSITTNTLKQINYPVAFNAHPVTVCQIGAGNGHNINYTAESELIETKQTYFKWFAGCYDNPNLHWIAIAY